MVVRGNVVNKDVEMGMCGLYLGNGRVWLECWLWKRFDNVILWKMVVEGLLKVNVLNFEVWILFCR